MLRRMRARLRALMNGTRRTADLVEELRSHLEAEADRRFSVSVENTTIRLGRPPGADAAAVNAAY